MITRRYRCSDCNEEHTAMPGRRDKRCDCGSDNTKVVSYRYEIPGPF